MVIQTAPLVRHKSRLWHAVQWLAEQGDDDIALVEEACQRFDLSPGDEEFLLLQRKQRLASSESD